MVRQSYHSLGSHLGGETTKCLNTLCVETQAVSNLSFKTSGALILVVFSIRHRTPFLLC